jgi:hypothetical protein
MKRIDQAGQAPLPPLLCSPLGSIVDSMHPYTFSAYRSFDDDASPGHCIAEGIWFKFEISARC